MKNIRISGFSLVELSIVLVILGLLVGGVLSGQSLIRAAELRSATTAMERLVTSTYTFRDKYMALPGDMSNAASFWGTWTGNSNPALVGGAKNGNGDGFIDTNAVADDERFNLFRHLALAGLIEGSYAGSYQDPQPTGNQPGVTTPPSRLGGTAMMFVHTAKGTNKIYGTQGNFYQLQSVSTPYAVIKPEEAWQIDTKLDDGKPGSGRIMGLNDNATMANRKCSSVPDFYNAGYGQGEYLVQENSVQCWMLFWQN